MELELKKAGKKQKGKKKKPAVPPLVHHEGDDYSQYENERFKYEQDRWKGGGPGGMT